ncbi:MAG: YigZ family protein [Lysobacteraceae bacterium]
MAETLAAAHRHECEIKRSRFLAIALSLDSAADAPALLAGLDDPSASHCCWAWRFGQDYRSHDAGEPAGSAGRPILAAIDGQGVDRVLVAVLRWFGGIKLGVGGLVRAYGGTAAECLRNAPRTPLVDLVQAEVHCAFEHIDASHRLFAGHGAAIIDTDYLADGARFVIELPRNALDALALALRESSRGRTQWRVADDG